MQKLDAIVAATGAVVLVVAIVGAALYGGSAATETFQISFATAERDYGPESGSAVGEGLVAEFNLTDRNITQVKVLVTLSGAAARVQPVSFTVQVEGPDGYSGEAEGTLAGTPSPAASATAEILVNVTAKPTDHTYDAADLAAATAHADTLATSNGTGAWKVTVRAAPQLPPNEPINAEVSMVATVFESRVSRDLLVPR